MLNREQFELLVKNDISCTLHPEIVFHQEKWNEETITTPCITVSCLVTNFHVPVVLMTQQKRYGTFQISKKKTYLENYSEQSLDMCLLEITDQIRYPKP